MYLVPLPPYYKAYELGGCGRFDFDIKKLHGGDITLHGPNEEFIRPMTFVDLTQLKDAWTPEWVRLILGNGAVIKCTFNETMVCKPEGKISFILQSLTKAIIFELFYYINGYFRMWLTSMNIHLKCHT